MFWEKKSHQTNHWGSTRLNQGEWLLSRGTSQNLEDANGHREFTREEGVGRSLPSCYDQEAGGKKQLWHLWGGGNYGKKQSWTSKDRPHARQPASVTSLTLPKNVGRVDSHFPEEEMKALGHGRTSPTSWGFRQERWDLNPRLSVCRALLLFLLATIDFQAYLFPAGGLLLRRHPNHEPLCEEM